MKYQLLFLLLVILASCAPHRKMVYLQDKAQQGDFVEVNPTGYRIRPNDILHIRVLTFDKETRDLFNFDDSRLLSGGYGSNLGMYIYGFTVNENGQVILPMLGEIELGGKTIEQAQEILQSRVDEYLVGATVSVKLANFMVTVLGEVKRPGNFFIYDNQFTLLDALGEAGDLTEFGNRKVNLVRRSENGLKFHTIDITSRAMVASELYYLQPGDIIYVEPQWVKRLGFSQFPFALIFSTISTTLLLINFFSN